MGFCQQVDMLGHNYVADQQEIVLVSYLAECAYEFFASERCGEERKTAVATKCDEEEVAESIDAL